MPRGIKDFRLKARRKDVKSVKMKHNSGNITFKVHCSSTRTRRRQRG
jgi:hypothetical protein